MRLTTRASFVSRTCKDDPGGCRQCRCRLSESSFSSHWKADEAALPLWAASATRTAGGRELGARCCWVLWNCINRRAVPTETHLIASRRTWERTRAYRRHSCGCLCSQYSCGRSERGGIFLCRHRWYEWETRWQFNPCDDSFSFQPMVSFLQWPPAPRGSPLNRPSPRCRPWEAPCQIKVSVVKK